MFSSYSGAMPAYHIEKKQTICNSTNTGSWQYREQILPYHKGNYTSLPLGLPGPLDQLARDGGEFPGKPEINVMCLCYTEVAYVCQGHWGAISGCTEKTQETYIRVRTFPLASICSHWEKMVLHHPASWN